MAKPKKRYVCQACGSVSHRWQGQCADCAEWNTLVEDAPATVFSMKHDLSSGGRAVEFVELDKPGPLPVRQPTGLAEFDRALVDAAVGCDDYRKNLGTLQWAAERAQRISGEAQTKILRLRDIDGFHKARRHAYGRLSSVIDQISPQILWLGEARDVLRKLPSTDPFEPCIVVAGSPNVGKSALISALSSGEPQVASYPFTTKQIHLGHFTHRRRVYQMVDTPGLLDRPMVDRNQIEMQAIAALEHLGDVLVFLVDRTSEATTPIEEQENLLREVRGLISERTILVVSSKSDLEDSTNVDDDARISSHTGEGLDELRSQLIEMIAADKVEDPLSLPENWPRKDENHGPIGN